ncbi:MAG: Fur family transcriptional regulator [Myxococcota bacterium]
MVPQPDPSEILRSYISEHGLKSSRQREVIAEVFFSSGGHLRVEELLERVRAVDPRIGQATVYRTMKLLTKCGLAQPRHFGDGHTRYEPVAPDEGEHHDHLICDVCGRIVEFMDERIEALQEEVARAHGFSVTMHKMELYGVCDRCRASGARRRRRPPPAS